MLVSSKTADYLKLHTIILIWGFTGILGAVITISSTAIVWYRTLIAFLVLAGFLLVKKQNLLIAKNLIWKYLGTGVIVAIHWGFFFEALKVSKVSVTLSVLASATLFTSILEPFLFKKKIVLYEILLGILVIAGLVTIFQFETEYTLGIIYSLISAFCASLFTTLNGLFIGNGGNALRISLYEMLGAAAVITLFYLFTGRLTADELSLFKNGMPTFWLDLIYLLILAVICTAIAFVVSVDVMKNLSPFTVSMSINMEPIYAIILALLFFGEKEQMSVGFYVGASLVMATIFANGIIKKIKAKK